MKIDITKAASFVKAGAIEALEPQVKAAQEALEQGTCAGNDFLGWMHLPSSITPAFIAELNDTAKVLQENCAVHSNQRILLEQSERHLGLLLSSLKTKQNTEAIL